MVYKKERIKRGIPQVLNEIKRIIDEYFGWKLIQHSYWVGVTADGVYACSNYDLTSHMLFSYNDDFDVTISFPVLSRIALRRTELFLDTLLLENL
jgi:hypothetical protein